MLFVSSFEKLFLELRHWPTYEGANRWQRPNSFPSTGKDKGRGDWFDRFLSTPILAFPHQGERRSKQDRNDMAPFFIFCGRA